MKWFNWVLKIHPKFKFLFLTFLRFMTSSMSIEGKLCGKKIFQLNICQLYVLIEGLSRILVYLVQQTLTSIFDLINQVTKIQHAKICSSLLDTMIIHIPVVS